MSHIWVLPSGSFMGIAIGLVHVKHHSVLEDVLEDIGAVSRPRLSWSLEHDLSLEDLA